jgi:hypothetical protein
LKQKSKINIRVILKTLYIMIAGVFLVSFMTPHVFAQTKPACKLGAVTLTLGKKTVTSLTEPIPIKVSIATLSTPAGSCTYNFDQWSEFSAVGVSKKTTPAVVKGTTTAGQPITLNGTFTLGEAGLTKRNCEYSCSY